MSRSEVAANVAPSARPMRGPSRSTDAPPVTASSDEVVK